MHVTPYCIRRPLPLYALILSFWLCDSWTQFLGWPENVGGHGRQTLISMREAGNKVRSVCCRPCGASAKVLVKCCHTLKMRHLPSPLLFDLIQSLSSQWPLTWHIAANNHDLIATHLFIYWFVSCGDWIFCFILCSVELLRCYEPNHFHVRDCFQRLLRAGESWC